MTELEQAEADLMKLTAKVAKLRKDAPLTSVKNYSFKILEGESSLLELFGDKETLFVIHNMGQGCRYCTLWADGINGFIDHLEDRFSVVLVSKDSPDDQRRLANSRGWRFRMASHAGGEYIREQSTIDNETNVPGLVCYTRKGNEIFKKNKVVFGPGDEFCSLWNILSLAGHGGEDWTPQFNYWKRPKTMDDGGQNLID